MSRFRHRRQVIPLMSVLVGFGLLWSWSFPSSSVAESNRTQSEASVDRAKADFLTKFPRFLYWPAGVKDAFVVSLLCDCEVSRLAMEVAERSDLDGVPFVFRRISDPEDVENAKVLYVGESSERELQDVVRAVGTRPVLVVSDREDGVLHGAGISFLVEKGKVHFQLNRGVLERQGIRVDFRLLSIAQTVIE